MTQVSVGKLGIITSLKLRIVREQPVRRTLTPITPTQLMGMLQGAQDEWAERRSLPGWMNETEFFWIVQRNHFLMVDFKRADDPTPSVREQVRSLGGRTKHEFMPKC